MWLALAARIFAQAPMLDLPDTVLPLRQQLELTIDPSEDFFQGKATIEVDVRQPLATLWLNGKQLSVSKAEVVQGETALPSRLISAGGEFLGLQMERSIQGPLTLRFEFHARLDDTSQSGLYRRKVGDQWYAFTTFTPIEARRVFPCFDEPRFKIPWKITLHVPHGDHAFSNAAELPSTATAGNIVAFAETKPLPAELIAFAVGPFDVFQGEGVRVITPRGLGPSGRAAAVAKSVVLPKLEAYTGISYAFGKLDFVALPDGFFAAVENPGLITYLADQLLIPPGEETADKERAIRALEAHEIAHQWFGNLVTQATWQDVWLSEGLATWMEWKIMADEEPAGRKWLEPIRDRERMMLEEGTKRARPVRRRVSTVEEIRDVYNRFVYDKGASILLMLEGWIGESALREGLHDYLAGHEFGNGSTEELISVLSKSGKVDAGPVIHAAADTIGVPMVRGKIDCSRTPKFTIEQKGSTALPVCWRAEGGTQQCAVVESGVKEIETKQCPAWVYWNSGGTGYYRTSWTGAQLKALNVNALTPAEKLTLVYDLRAQKSDRKAAAEVLLRLAEDEVAEVAQAARLNP